MRGFGLQGLELRQRLAGTFETGGAERASFIRANIIPALQGELSALEHALAVARAEEVQDARLIAQREEEVAAKQNEILQAQLDAQEQGNEIAKQMLDAFRGTTGFEFAGQSWTDLLTFSAGS